MAEDTAPIDEMNYEALTQTALRGIMRASLERATEPDGLPGQHHFYITFVTRAPGAEVPADLLQRYPDTITIVIQHKFWDLKVTEEGFSIRLQFGGLPKVLKVPFNAVMRFEDPSVRFLLQFEPVEPVDDEAEEAVQTEADLPAEPEDGEGPKVVSLDQFRKK